MRRRELLVLFVQYTIIIMIIIVHKCYYYWWISVERQYIYMCVDTACTIILGNHLSMRDRKRLRTLLCLSPPSTQGEPNKWRENGTVMKAQGLVTGSTNAWHTLSLGSTTCSRCSDPFYMVTYYINLATTPWTHSIFILYKDRSLQAVRWCTPTIYILVLSVQEGLAHLP